MNCFFQDNGSVHLHKTAKDDLQPTLFSRDFAGKARCDIRIIASVITHQRTDGNIFIDFRPMYPNAFANQAPVAALRRRRIAQSGKPLQRR
jgi:hypothetical protein